MYNDYRMSRNLFDFSTKPIKIDSVLQKKFLNVFCNFDIIEMNMFNYLW